MQPETRGKLALLLGLWFHANPVHVYVKTSEDSFPPMQVMDYGYPQFTEAQILAEFIKTDAHKMEVGVPSSVEAGSAAAVHHLLPTSALQARTTAKHSARRPCRCKPGPPWP